jgi:hypothetical protein
MDQLDILLLLVFIAKQDNCFEKKYLIFFLFNQGYFYTLYSYRQ